MTSTSIPASAPVRLHGHWLDPVRVEATDAFTLRRVEKALRAAGYSVTASPRGTDFDRGSHDLWCDDRDTRSLRRVLIEASIPVVIATATRPTPAEEAEDEAGWQEAEARMEAEAEAAVEAQRLRPTPDEWTPF